jgi:vacuolar-type H+-ATPase subunit F/Vma7
MKRHLISIISILAVLGLAWVAFGQSEGSTGERSSQRAMWRERQQKAVSAIEEQLAKIKTAMESSSVRPQNWQELSEEERNKLRETFRKVREEREQSIAIIEQELAKLKGRRTLQRAHEESISELSAVHELAKKEKATETAASIEKLIAAKKKAFEESMQKLGLPERTRRSGN